MVKRSSQSKGLGDFIAVQRQAAGVSLRQLAEAAGVSNPYLSQIERGLRKPSAEVMQQLAKALRVSAESLYVHAGILDPVDHGVLDVEKVVLADPAITERQKQSLLEVYTAFVHLNQGTASTQGLGLADATDKAKSASTSRVSRRPESSEATTGRDKKEEA